ncbi:MAG: hypothetical protein ACI9FJ_000065 [Alteromonadaceae bacterium]|jgi:hypothetical protein
MKLTVLAVIVLIFFTRELSAYFAGVIRLFRWRYPPISLALSAYFAGVIRLFRWRYPPISLALSAFIKLLIN